MCRETAHPAVAVVRREGGVPAISLNGVCASRTAKYHDDTVLFLLEYISRVSGEGEYEAYPYEDESSALLHGGG